MAYKNGIDRCRKVISKLASANTFESRIEDAFAEMSQLGIMDTAINYFTEFVDLNEKYILTKNFNIKLDGVVKKIHRQTEKISELSKLSDKLLQLCNYIIEYNLLNVNS